MSSPSPTHVHFATEEAKYLVFNFHRPDDLDEIEGVLQLPPERAPALLLIGDEGIGRRYLLQAAVFRRRQAGARIRYAAIDLDGFEPGQHDDAFTKHLDRLAEKYKPAGNSRWKEMAKWIAESKIKLTVRTAALFSLAVESSLPIKELASVFSSGAVGQKGPAFAESDAFARSVQAIAGDSQLLVHVTDREAAPGILVDWLFRLRNRQPAIYVAFSGSPLGNAGLPDPFRRIEFSPLERREVRSMVDTRFSPNHLPDYLCDLLHQYGQGWPSLMAAKMSDLITSEQVICGADGGWRMSALATEERIAGKFTDSILDRFREALENASAPCRAALENTLQLAVLCGACVPIRRLMEFQGFNDDLQNDVIDAIDELFDPAFLFHDHEYGDPRFPGELIYSFANPVIPHALRNGMDATRREEQATRLLQFLSERIPRHTRGQRRLFLNLAGEAYLSQVSMELFRELEWFAAVDDAEDLAAMLRERVRRGDIRPEAVLQVERQSRESLLPHVRLAMLEALCEPATEGRPWQTIGLSSDTLRSFLTSHAEALLAAGFYWLAFDRVSEALAITQDSWQSMPFLNLRGLCAQAMGDFSGARRDFESAIPYYGQDRSQILELLVVKSNLALALDHLSELREARTLEEEVLETRTRLFGAEHPDTLRAKSKLAWTLGKLSDLNEARTLQEEVLEASSRLLKVEHPDTLRAKSNLAWTLGRLGELQEARTLLEEVLEMRTRLLGIEHPDTLEARSNLAWILGGLGGLQEAQTLQEDVLEARTRLLGIEHTDTLEAKSNLAWTRGKLGELNQARTLREEVLKVRTLLLGVEHPDTLRAKSNLALTLGDLGELQEARTLQDEVLAASLRLLGVEHPDSLRAKSMLAWTLGKLGELQEAQTLDRETLEASTRLLGVEHPDTLRVRSGLAWTLGKLGELQEARTLQEAVLESRTRLLGAEHPDTLKAKSNLAETVQRLGNEEGKDAGI
jgi:tetratricopeptide (TPR) repeat protein